MTQKLHSRKYLKQIRKDLRNNMTSSEARLWSCLKGKQLHDRKFRRQHSIGNFIVDFFCFSENLIIEVDGTSHNNYTSEIDDIERDNYLIKQGFQILRFEAIDIKDNLDAVLDKIIENFNPSVSPRQLPGRKVHNTIAPNKFGNPFSIFSSTLRGIIGGDKIRYLYLKQHKLNYKPFS